MSRIGKQTIELPEKVTLTVADNRLTVTGPLGTLSRSWPERLEVKVEGSNASVAPKKMSPELSALWGTTAAHLKNLVVGVTRGYEKRLLIEGVGYRAQVSGANLTLNLGLSHPVLVTIPEGVKVTADKGLLTISGIDKELVGQFAASVRALKKPEPYKGKGIRYENEVVRRKEGKKVVT